jgi:hypothetical protein
LIYTYTKFVIITFTKTKNMETNITDFENKSLEIPKKKKSRWKLKFFLIFLLVSALTVYFLFFKPYSHGFRDGYVTKLSKKGYIFKTWEGELRTNVLSLNEPWKFSVAKDEVANKLNKIDQRVYVKLHYNEYIFQIFAKGDTKYFIDSVELLPAPNGVDMNPYRQN